MVLVERLVKLSCWCGIGSPLVGLTLGEGGKIDNDQESGHGVNQHFQISLKFFRVFSLKRCLHLCENFMLNWHLRITNNKVCVRE